MVWIEKSDASGPEMADIACAIFYQSDVVNFD